MFYEEFEPGDVFRTDGVTLTESSIIDFAVQYDPQRFHVDREAAGESIYGGIIASGWQVCSLGFRMVAQANFLGPEAMGSPGLDKLRWHKPVRPGDTIRVEARVTEKRSSSSRDDRGYVTFEFDTLNQDGDVVMSYTVIEILRRRPAAADETLSV